MFKDPLAVSFFTGEFQKKLTARGSFTCLVCFKKFSGIFLNALNAPEMLEYGYPKLKRLKQNHRSKKLLHQHRSLKYYLILEMLRFDYF